MKRKSIGIITFQRCDNFGAELQAYALGAKLRNMGYDAENIDYLFYKHPRHVVGPDEAPVLPVSLVNKIKEMLFPLVNFLKGRSGSAKFREERHAKFDKWFVDNVKVGSEYRSVRSLYENPPRYDVYITGSDQVWNPRLYSNIKPYFLDFVSQGAKCISYASSFGVGEFSGAIFKLYKKWLRRYSAIGVREETGLSIVKAMALGVEVKQTVDPTLLLTAEDWRGVSIMPDAAPEGRYLLLYDLIDSPETVALAKQWAKKRNLQLVRVGDGCYGPGEFLWLFSHAEAVVTNSFHGTVFSILNEKQFWSVIPTGMTNSSRIESLLGCLHISNRLVRAIDVSAVETNSEIDYLKIGELLDGLRKEAVDYLQRNIDGDSVRLKDRVPVACYAVKHVDEKVRAHSTSGGAFTALAEVAFAHGGVVLGAAFDDNFKNVKHVAVESLADLERVRKSKYVWSDPREAYRLAKKYVENGRMVLFSGTPCQCTAVRRIIGGNRLLITVDFVCHGTPPIEEFQHYINEIENSHRAKVTEYQFRDKSAGWNFPLISYKLANGKLIRVIPWLDSYFRDFSLNRTLREICYRCKYTNLNRPGDITIADCWRVGSVLPAMDDNKGTSNVLINSEIGVQFWKSVCEKGNVISCEYDLEDAQVRNHALMMPNNRGGRQRPLMYYRLLYWVKRLGWFYFKGRQ